MKKLAIAGLLAAALSLTALSQQKASAWGCGCGSSGEFNLSIGFSISGCWNRQPCCSPSCGDGYSYCPDVSMYTGGCGYGGYCAAPYAAPYAAPQAAPIAAPTAATGVQNAAYFPANYSYPSGYGYGYNYGYYQAPSYWYGR